jgi:MFS-type transporter involved in bile tolerance (Atg22 family)
MLIALFLSVLIGLAARDFGGRQRLAIITIGLVVAGLYQFFGNRIL